MHTEIQWRMSQENEAKHNYIKTISCSNFSFLIQTSIPLVRIISYFFQMSLFHFTQSLLFHIFSHIICNPPYYSFTCHTSCAILFGSVISLSSCDVYYQLYMSTISGYFTFSVCVCVSQNGEGDLSVFLFWIEFFRIILHRSYKHSEVPWRKWF
jgi:hypothetical protein